MQTQVSSAPNSISVGPAVPTQSAWDDPLIKLQVEEFRKFVDKIDSVGVQPAQAFEIAERLCEWSRSILNRTFGRINRSQVAELNQLFERTSVLIHGWDVNNLSQDQVSRIGIFAENIRKRVGYLPK
jgi:hypothetical protein